MGTFHQAQMERMDAVDWRMLPQNLAKLPITLFSRYLLEFPQQQPTMRSSHRQLDTLSTVAIYLSHMNCWQWLVDHPQHPYVMICEDDACFDGGFRAMWQQTVVPLLEVPEEWDCLILGYFSVSGPEMVITVPRSQPLVSTMTVPQFYGAHAYIITRTGAEYGVSFLQRGPR